MPATRTRLALFTEILSAATGLPPSHFASLPQLARATDAPMTEPEYEAQRAALLAELPGIQAWVAKGIVEAVAEAN
jgi:hypothetical protein